MRETTVLDFSLIDQFRGIKSSSLLASINGIVYLQCSNNSKFLLNPITAELLTLPPLVGFENLCGPSQSYVFFLQHQFSHGFGVSVTGVYKVVQIHNQTGFMDPPRVHVYTLGVGTGDWRRLQPPPLGHYRIACANGISFDSDIYWILQGGDHRVLKFTMDTESFDLIDGPMEYDKCVARLGVLNGKLCVILSGLNRYLVTVLDGCAWSEYASCEFEYGFVPTLTNTK
ncbi:F-box/kelch-repeat protein At3g06240-like [Bidens hawaiensis]|uniref:F-box/kelch-repeat protein At3g06240-like n=1 Tax=Bidens hawaiensis TaxID=980011 RepID=UPI00404A5780